MLKLYIGNKNYSSWSLRPWLLMTQFSIPFEEVQLRLSWNPESDFKRTLRPINPAGRVPVLVHDGFAIWETPAIIEYLAESHPEHPIWPHARRDRARARSLCAEMHAGFGALRSAFPMNVEASLPQVAAHCLQETPAVGADLLRLEQMWGAQLEASGGPFLFGGFSAADAYFAPVCSRLETYQPPLSLPTTEAYASAVLGLPSMQAWCAAARAEHTFVPEDEPYRAEPVREDTLRFDDAASVRSPPDSCPTSG